MLNPTILKHYAAEDLDALSLLPDFMPYSFNGASAYHAYMQGLLPREGGYLKVEHGTLSRVGWLQFAWQTVKGWFGFPNLCDYDRTKIVLQKLLYWGYLNHYTQAGQVRLEPWQEEGVISRKFIEHVASQKSAEHSAWLQDVLLRQMQAHPHLLDNFFVNAREVLARYVGNDSFNTYFDTNRYDFGECYFRKGLLTNVIELDIQSPSLRNRVMRHPDFIHSLPREPYYRDAYAKVLAEYVKSIEQSKQTSLIAQVRATLTSAINYVLGLPQETKLMLNTAWQLQPEIASEYPLLFVPFLIDAQQPAAAYQVLLKFAKRNYDAAVTLLFQYSNHPQFLSAIQKNSDLALELALYWMDDKRKNFERAFSLHQSIPEHYPSDAVHYFSSQQQYNKAFAVIEKLYTKGEKELALELLKTHFKTEEAIVSVTADTPLAKAFANQLLAESKAQGVAWQRFSSWLSGNDANMQNYIFAAKLNSQVALEHPVEFFRYYVKKQQWTDAWSLFSKVDKAQSEVRLPEAERKQLAAYFNQQAEQTYELGLEQKKNQQWKEAESNYSLSLQQKRKAYALHWSDDAKREVAIHYRLYAQLLFDKATALNENLNLETCKKLIHKLNKAKKHWTTAYDDDRWPVIRARILQAMEPILYQCLLHPYMHTTDYVDKRLHIEQTMHYAQQLARILDELIELKTTCSEIEITDAEHAYRHFLLAEIIAEYELTTEGPAAEHYRKAVELAPKHPYYLLRLSEVLPPEEKASKEYRAQGCIEMRERGLNGATDYIHWFDERWFIESAKIHRLPDAKSFADVVETPASSWRFF